MVYNFCQNRGNWSILNPVLEFIFDKPYCSIYYVFHNSYFLNDYSIKFTTFMIWDSLTLVTIIMCVFRNQVLSSKSFTAEYIFRKKNRFYTIFLFLKNFWTMNFLRFVETWWTFEFRLFERDGYRRVRCIRFSTYPN